MAGAYGALHRRPLHEGPNQNQAIAQKLGILGEKVTSMTVIIVALQIPPILRRGQGKIRLWPMGGKLQRL